MGIGPNWEGSKHGTCYWKVGKGVVGVEYQRLAWVVFPCWVETESLSGRLGSSATGGGFLPTWRVQPDFSLMFVVKFQKKEVEEPLWETWAWRSWMFSTYAWGEAVQGEAAQTQSIGCRWGRKSVCSTQIQSIILVEVRNEGAYPLPKLPQFPNRMLMSNGIHSWTTSLSHRGLPWLSHSSRASSGFYSGLSWPVNPTMGHFSVRH